MRRGVMAGDSLFHCTSEQAVAHRVVEPLTASESFVDGTRSEPQQSARAAQRSCLGMQIVAQACHCRTEGRRDVAGEASGVEIRPKGAVTAEAFITAVTGQHN